MPKNKHKRDSHESSLKDKGSAKKKCREKVSTTLFPANSFGVPLSSSNSNELTIKQEDLETEKDERAPDCEILKTVIKTEDNHECGYITDTDTTENELQTNSEDKEQFCEENEGIDSECLLNECLATNTYSLTQPVSPMDNSVCSQNNNVMVAESQENNGATSPKREKECFSIETAKYFNVNGRLSIDDITKCLEYLQTFKPTNSLSLSSAEPKVINYPNLEQHTSFSSTIIPQNISVETSPHAEKLMHSKSEECTNMSKISSGNVYGGKVFENASSEIGVSKSSSTPKNNHKELNEQILTSKNESPVLLEKTTKPAMFPNYASTSKADCTAFQQNSGEHTNMCKISSGNVYGGKDFVNTFSGIRVSKSSSTAKNNHKELNEQILTSKNESPVSVPKTAIPTIFPSCTSTSKANCTAFQQNSGEYTNMCKISSGNVYGGKVFENASSEIRVLKNSSTPKNNHKELNEQILTSKNESPVSVPKTTIPTIFPSCTSTSKANCTAFQQNSGEYINMCKISSGNVYGGKVFENVTSEIRVSKSSSTPKNNHKELNEQILTSKNESPVSVPKTSKPTVFPSYASTSKANFMASQQNSSVRGENITADAYMCKRKPEGTYEKSLLKSKKVKKQHSSCEISDRLSTNSIPSNIENTHFSYEMSNRLSTDSIPTSIINTEIQTINSHASQSHGSQIPDVRDPRLRKNVISGTNGYQSGSQHVARTARNFFFNETDIVGPNPLHQDFIPTHQEMPFCILDWDPKWLSIKNDDYPPLMGDFRPPHVKDTYTSKDEYSKTYCSIHLLSIWQAIHYSFKCQTSPKTYKCNVLNVEEVRSYFKNECISLMPFNDMPKYSSIILIGWKSNKISQNCFAYVYEIKPTPSHRSSQDSSSENRELLKIKFFCYTTKKIENYKKIHVVIQKLCRVRVHMKQYEALCLPENSDLMQSIVNPFRNAHKIKAVILPSNDWMDRIKDFVMKWQSDIVMTLIFNLNNNETLIILTLVSCLMTHSSILICMRDMGKFLKIATYLKKRCVLAVKESEVSVPRDIQQYTIRSHAKELCKTRPMSQNKAELEVLKHSKITLTLISNMYFNDTTTPILGSNLICIIDDAHKCTEADTSLPLSFNPANVFLLGDSTQYPHMDHRQQKLKYNTTLFHRLSKYAK